MSDIYDLLSEDHQKVKQLLEKIEDTSNGADKTRQKLLTQLKQELEIHTRFEEDVFYPQADEKTGMKEAIQDAFEEHREADELLQSLSEAETTSDEWTETIRELKDALSHHIRDEEEKLFPVARKRIDPVEAENMGRQYEEMKKEAHSKG